MKDPRIENVVALLHNADLELCPVDALEPTVGGWLARTLSGVAQGVRRAGTGIDGSVRNPDDARRVLSAGSTAPLDLAIEYKLYRNRKTGAGEMDRGLGQCISYAEKYEAVLFFIVYMQPPAHPIPAHWLDRADPLHVGHKAPGIPVYFAARPRSWRDPWAGMFTREPAPAP